MQVHVLSTNHKFEMSRDIYAAIINGNVIQFDKIAFKSCKRCFNTELKLNGVSLIKL